MSATPCPMRVPVPHPPRIHPAANCGLAPLLGRNDSVKPKGGRCRAGFHLQRTVPDASCPCRPDRRADPGVRPRQCAAAAAGPEGRWRLGESDVLTLEWGADDGIAIVCPKARRSWRSPRPRNGRRATPWRTARSSTPAGRVTVTSARSPSPPRWSRKRRPEGRGLLPDLHLGRDRGLGNGDHAADNVTITLKSDPDQVREGHARRQRRLRYLRHHLRADQRAEVRAAAARPRVQVPLAERPPPLQMRLNENQNIQRSPM